jgi:hypothetical protein
VQREVRFIFPGFRQDSKEEEMKVLWKLLVIGVLASLLAGCGGAPATQAPAPAPATEAAAPATEAAPPAEAPLSAEEQWLKDNQLGKYFTLDQDWAAIEAAAKKEGSVTVYAGSSRIEDQIAIWSEV